MINPKIEQMKGVSSVGFTKNPPEEVLEFLNGLLKTKKISVRFYGNQINGMESLNWLELLPNLEILQIANTNTSNPVDSVEVFSNLPRLRFLGIQGLSKKLADFSVFKEMSELQALLLETGARGTFSHSQHGAFGYLQRLVRRHTIYRI